MMPEKVTKKKRKMEVKLRMRMRAVSTPRMLAQRKKVNCHTKSVVLSSRAVLTRA